MWKKLPVRQAQLERRDYPASPTSFLFLCHLKSFFFLIFPSPPLFPLPSLLPYLLSTLEELQVILQLVHDHRSVKFTYGLVISQPENKQPSSLETIITKHQKTWQPRVLVLSPLHGNRRKWSVRAKCFFYRKKGTPWYEMRSILITTIDGQQDTDQGSTKRIEKRKKRTSMSDQQQVCIFHIRSPQISPSLLYFSPGLIECVCASTCIHKDHKRKNNNH